MLIKRSSKNQVVIPKVILERAGLGPQDIYFDIGYSNNRIMLTPMQLDEKISPEALSRFEEQALKQEPGDQAFDSVEGLIKKLHQKHHR